MKKHLLNAALLCTALIASATEPVDITPSGLNFDSYSSGDLFKITASTGNGGWSVPLGTFSADAFKTDGQQTVLVDRGGSIDQNTIDTDIAKGVLVHTFDKAGKCLIINQAWSPTNNGGAIEDRINDYADMRLIKNPQLNFYVDPSAIKTETDKVHYIRVRLVYNVLYRGCHYLAQAETNRTVIKGIYATDDRGWVVPEKDNEEGDKHAEDASVFGKWVGETGKIADIPADPQIYVPTDGDQDPWDICHGDGVGNISVDHKAAYLMNSERFRVYEFDFPLTMPNAASVQVNINSFLATYVFKEIKFTDLGTNEADATLLGKRKLGWTYYNEYSTSGIDDIAVDENDNAPAVYYNLQGVEVRNPANGIYIVRRGNKVTKEVIR